MARLHGRNALLYIQGAGAEAVSFSNAADYAIDVNFATVDVSQLGDDWAQTIRGQAQFSGQFGGPVESTSRLAWDAMVATTARKFYLYPDKTALGGYYYGTCWVEIGIKGGTSAAVTFVSKMTGVGQLGVMP